MTAAQRIVLWVLVAVVLATVAAVLATNLGLVGHGSDIQNKFAVWGSVSVLGEIVALFVLVGRKVFNLSGQVSIQIAPSPEFPSLRPGRIRWNNSKCVLVSENVEISVTLVNTGVGQTWTVHIPVKLADKLASSDLIEFRFQDNRGNEWAAGPLLRNVYVFPLQALDSEKVRAAYASADQ